LQWRFRWRTAVCIVWWRTAQHCARRWATQSKADRITLDYRRAGLDAKMEAVLDFAVKLTKQMVECSPADLAHLQSLRPDRKKKSGM
jgi:hypothetical protein